MKTLHTICLLFWVNFTSFISRGVRITPSSSEEIDSKITAHLVCI